MCGRCRSDYAPPVYSYSLSCVNCTTSNWGKYTAVSLLPLTAFFVFIISCRISATSPKLNGYILLVQVIFSPPIIIYTAYHHKKQVLLYTLNMVMSVMGIWNLDFFCSVYSPFCLHPDTNTLKVVALDYLIAVYPLLLIGVSYFLGLLYDENVRLAVCICKPFVTPFIRFCRQWNIKSSLVDASATLLLLSYVKILSVSMDLLMPVVLYNEKVHVHFHYTV